MPKEGSYKYPIYISSADMPVRRISRSGISFGVLNGVIAVNWREHMRVATEVRVGEMYLIINSGSRLEVTKMNPPQRKADLLMWLLSFDKKSRTYTESDYRALLEQKRLECAWRNYCDWGLEDKTYAFTVCNSIQPGKILRIAAYVDEKKRPVDTELVFEVLKQWCHPLTLPRPYVERLLRRRVYFSEGLMDTVCELNPALFSAKLHV